MMVVGSIWRRHFYDRSDRQICRLRSAWFRRSVGTTILLLLLLLSRSANNACASPLSKRANPQAGEPTYITDVTGKRVRIVGPRFYPNPTKHLEFPGRKGNRDPIQTNGRHERGSINKGTSY